MTRLKIIIIRYDEIGLKGKNKRFFIDCLVKNIREKTSDLNLENIRTPRGRILIDLYEDTVEVCALRLQTVPGIVSLSIGMAVARDFDQIAECGIRWIKQLLDKAKKLKFCVRTQRSDKTFPFNSMDCDREIGSRILKAYHSTGLTVSINESDLVIEVEIGKEETVVFNNRIPGLGGLPVGCSGTVLSLLSGGIDSPVASFRMMKRGCRVDFIFFENRPFLGRAAYDKVVRLLHYLNRYQSKGQLFVVPFSDIQVAIRNYCSPSNRIILYRRMMYRIAERVADQYGYLGLVTGESLGQVASQTLENLSAVSALVSASVFRPLIGMDKIEIIKEAKKIGTYAISTERHPDCCSIFMPSRPKIRARKSDLEDDETRYPWENLMEETLKNIEIVEKSELVKAH